MIITYLLILYKLRLHPALKFYLLINHSYRNDNLVYFINFLDLYFSWRKIKKAYTKFKCSDLSCCSALFSSIRCLFKFLTFFSKFSEEKSSKSNLDSGRKILEPKKKIFGPWWRHQRLAGLKLQVNNFQKVSFVYLCLLTFLKKSFVIYLLKVMTGNGQLTDKRSIHNKWLLKKSTF